VSRDQPAGDARSLAGVAARYGFRRVERVHLRVDGRATVAMVTGVVHRYPRTVRVALPIASRLVAAGAPLVIEHVGSPATTGHG
jgi:hypothetical protein